MLFILCELVGALWAGIFWTIELRLWIVSGLTGNFGGLVLVLHAVRVFCGRGVFLVLSLAGYVPSI